MKILVRYERLCKAILIIGLAVYAGQSLVQVYNAEKERIEKEQNKTQIEQLAAVGFGEEQLSEVKYFPVAAERKRKDDGTLADEMEVCFSFEDGFGEARTYGGDRKHEGTDIMALNGSVGYYPVISMTDGVIENMGWLELGGYRIGVRSPSGVYYYYAHLDSYAEDLKEGMEVEAGELLGFLGDSGYGEEGTRGQFPSHLHLGVYLTGEEAINPYPLLQYSEKFMISFCELEN